MPDVKWLFETQGQRGAYIISTSKPIPQKGSTEDASPQPPHRQAPTITGASFATRMVLSWSRWSIRGSTGRSPRGSR